MFQSEKELDQSETRKVQKVSKKQVGLRRSKKTSAEAKKLRDKNFLPLREGKNDHDDEALYWFKLIFDKLQNEKKEIIQIGRKYTKRLTHEQTGKYSKRELHYAYVHDKEPSAKLRLDGRIVWMRYVGPQKLWVYTSFPAISVNVYPTDTYNFVPRNDGSPVKFTNNLLEENQLCRLKRKGWEEYILRIKSFSLSRREVAVKVVIGPDNVGAGYDVQARLLVPLSGQETKGIEDLLV